MRIYILLTFLIYSIDAFASIRQNLTTLDNSTDLDYGNQSTNRDILIEIEILPRAWRWKIDAYGNLHQLRVLSIIQFILPTSLIIPPVLGITSLWREVEKPEHYKWYRNWLVWSMLFTIVYGCCCIGLLPVLCGKFDLFKLLGFIICWLAWSTYLATVIIGWPFAYGALRWEPIDWKPIFDPE